jgi:ureidoglycolate dehydrogenase (NAD+)
MPALDHERLSVLMRRQLDRRAVAPSSAEHVVSALVEASLRGVDSHGVNLFPHYCASVDAGRITKEPAIRVVEQGGATAVVDADFAFGHHAGAVAMDHAVDMARSHGIAAVAVRNSSHFAAAAYYGLRAARRDMIGFAFTNADSLVKVPNGAAAFFGTNPICITVPMDGEDPLCLDMATSMVSWNKIVNHRLESRPLGPNWAFDGDGLPTTDPQAARTLNPAGEYKGFGLGLMIDVFCAVLAGGPLGADLLPMYVSLSERRAVSHFFMAIDPTAFAPLEVVRRRVADLAARIRALPPSDPSAPVMVPGDPEKRTFQKRLRSGIPMDGHKFDEFCALDPEFKTVAVA